MAQDQKNSRGLNILCIDGGGVRGLSPLLLLSETTNRLAGLEDCKSPFKMADYFDIIAGTGTGGIIACMLGRLGMATEDATNSYIKLAKNAFSRKYIGTSGSTAYKGTKLKDALKLMIRDATGDENTAMKDENLGTYSCKTLVFAMSKHNITAGVPALFRSYPSATNQMPNCSIWEALYATMAHPDLFKAIEIQDGPIRQYFIGGELGCSNPISHVLTEVKSIFPDRHVSCIMSIGAGHARTIGIPKLSVSQRILRGSTQTTVAVKNMATDSERAAEEMAIRFQGATQVYYRLNVDQGLQVIEDDWEQRGDVKVFTAAYIGKVETNRALNQAAQAIKERNSVLPVTYIDGSVQWVSEKVIAMRRCPAPTTLFTGREDQVRQVGGCIAGNVYERRVCVVYGLGGAGKTQLALKTIETNRKSWQHVLYVDAISKESIEGALQDFAKVKGLGRTHNDTLNWLESCDEPWLLAFDNADHPSLDLFRYLPGGNYGSILITTRLRDLAALARGSGSVCHVSSMQHEDGLALLLRLACIQDLEVSECEMEAVGALLKDLGYLALAIVHAGAYIGHSNISVTAYRELFLVQRQKTLEQYGKLKVKLDAYEKSVYTTWKMCYELLELNGDARPILWLISYLHHDDIRQELFRRATINLPSYGLYPQSSEVEQDALRYMRSFLGNFIDCNGNWDSLRFLNALNELASYSLVDFDRVNQSYRIHVLVQDWARTVIPHPRALALECTVLLLSASIDRGDAVESHNFRRRLRMHVETTLSECGGEIGMGHAGSFAQVYTEIGNWDKAERLQAQLQENMKKVLGEQHPLTLDSISSLALTYWNQGRWDRAQPLQEYVFDVQKRLLGEGHQSTLTSMNNLASTYKHQGQFDKAESLQEKIIAACGRLLGKEHPLTLICMNNLASTYEAQGQWHRAELLHEIVLHARRHVLGEEHPLTLISMGSLAGAHQNQGRWDIAQSIREHVIKTQKRLLGEEHPSTLTSMNNLAMAYRDQGRLDMAESLHEYILDAQKRLVGDRHPHTLSSMNNLASTYRNQGRLDEAERLQEQVLNLQKKFLGGGHPDVLVSMNNLAVIYQRQRRWDEAAALQEQVLSLRRSLLGEKHPYTWTSRNDLARTYCNQGRLDEAELLQEQALRARKQLLGEGHPHTLTTLNDISLTHLNRGRLNEAQLIQEQVLDARKRLLGEEHPDTLDSMSNLASVFEAQGRLAEAKGLLNQVITLSHCRIGDQHPTVVLAREKLEIIQSQREAVFN